MKATTLIPIIALTLACNRHPNLYSNSDYYITDSSVIQGSYAANAISDSLIKSNYTEKNQLALMLKFSINGIDNEAGMGLNHNVVVEELQGNYSLPLFTFGNMLSMPDTATFDSISTTEGLYLTIRCNLKPLLSNLDKKGSVVLANGYILKKGMFKTLSVRGGPFLPLTWDLNGYLQDNQLLLTDSDNDSIYQTTLKLDASATNWKLSADISEYPKYHSSQTLSNALYNLSLEEVVKSTTTDNYFIAGQLWPDPWTRDISNSIYLSLALINPTAAKISLMKKVQHNRIIQDTGSGGSWPVSTDRLIWALAAWEIYKVTGSKTWLDTSYSIISNSVAADLKTCEGANGLTYGETSYMDWREQSYPKWMGGTEIFHSQTLVTSCIHYQTYTVLAEMAQILNKPTAEYTAQASKIKDAINTLLYLPNQKLYAMYLYGNIYPSLCTRVDTKGNMLSVLFDIAANNKQSDIVASMPVTSYGTPCFMPQIPEIQPYHNNGIWPLVTAYYLLAGAKVQNEKAVLHAIGSIYRQSALFKTNKENMVAETGCKNGTAVNSNRQLWSIAANLAIVYKVFLGIELNANNLTFKPVIPVAFNGCRTLQGLKYRNAILNITVNGYGSTIKQFKVNGKIHEKPVIGCELDGLQEIEITMSNQPFDSKPINLIQNYNSPSTPLAAFQNNVITWNSVEGAVNYNVIKNGKSIALITDTSFTITNSQNYSEYQISAINTKGVSSFLSKPILINYKTNCTIIEAEILNNTSKPEQIVPLHSGKGVYDLSKQKNSEWFVTVNNEGNYAFTATYFNNGSYTSGNNCALRSAYLNNNFIGTLVMPVCDGQFWQQSSVIKIHLKAGANKLQLNLDPWNANMNELINTAYIDKFEFLRID